ncbi:MAG: MBL fold metallo-hydrolase RNA specificity domain-containing protein [Methanomassiliicoccales archaeon]
MSVKLTVYDGCDTIGGNKIFLECDDYGVLLDFGINYEKLGKYYEEFLAPRTGRGIYDYLCTGQLPKVNVYRDDLIPADIDISDFRKLRVNAVFASHAHLDHVGMIPMLNMEIPLIGSPMTYAILKCLRDCDSHRIEHEIMYSGMRKRCCNGRLLVSERKKPFLTRSLVVTAPISKKLEEFLTACPWQKGSYPPDFIDSSEISIEFRHFDVDHSIYGASAFAIHTPLGWIVYSGDLRMHGRFADKTKEFISEAKKLHPIALIIEGTRIDATSEDVSEDDVREKCAAAVADEKDLVVADFSPRNFERLETFKKIASEYGRELVVLMKDAYYLDALSCVHGSDQLEGIRIYQDLKKRIEGFEKKIVEKYEDALIDSEEIAVNPGSFIVCFSFWDMNRLLDIRPDGGTYIYSSSEAHTEDQLIDFVRLKNWLKMFRMKIKGFKVCETLHGQQPVFEIEPGYHASGHASQHDIFKIIEAIDPEIVIPVHTKRPNDFLRLEQQKILIPSKNNEVDLDRVLCEQKL